MAVAVVFAIVAFLVALVVVVFLVALVVVFLVVALLEWLARTWPAANKGRGGSPVFDTRISFFNF